MRFDEGWRVSGVCPREAAGPQSQASHRLALYSTTLGRARLDSRVLASVKRAPGIAPGGSALIAGVLNEVQKRSRGREPEVLGVRLGSRGCPDPLELVKLERAPYLVLQCQRRRRCMRLDSSSLARHGDSPRIRAGRRQ